MISTETLEAKYENMAEQIWEIKEDVKGLSISIAVNHKMVMDKFDLLDTKYATKTSVNRIWIIIWSIIGFVFTFVGALGLNHFLTK